MKTGLKVLGAILLLGLAVWGIERLIVTDREAILGAADAAAQALGRGEIAKALEVLHPEALTSVGSAAQTQKMIEDELKKLPIEKVNLALRSLEVVDGIGRMSVDVFLIPRDKSMVPAWKLQVSLEWKKDGETWKIFRGESPGLSGVK